MTRARALTSASVLLSVAALTGSAPPVPSTPAQPHREPRRVSPQAGGRFHGADLHLARGPAIRGVTVGPIESSLHPRVGYGSPAYQETLRQARRMGANWVSITPFGRLWNKRSTGIALDFEAPFEDNRRDVEKAIDQAHEQGLRVMLVPHLWVESGEWRGDLDPETDEGWRELAASYRRFVLTWARVAERKDAEMFSVGVELRSWVTTYRAPSFLPIIDAIRETYHGPLTYGANWDDADHTVIFGKVDVIGVNAFYPLAKQEGATLAQLVEGGRKSAWKGYELATLWDKPVIFNEFGYTTRPDPAVKPWEWPDNMRDVTVDEAAQAEAYLALLEGYREEPWFGGMFLWRVYADPNDASQEAEWGFSPRGKRAELVLRDAFAASWAADDHHSPYQGLFRRRNEAIGRF